MRTTYIIGNWKMNGSLETINQFSEQFNTLIAEDAKSIELAAANKTIQLVICPPVLYLHSLFNCLKPLSESAIAVGAQAVSEHSQGAYTGDLSANMLNEVGASYIIVGHSERRQYHDETDQQIGKISAAVIQAGMLPVICVGETEQQNADGQTNEVIEQQLTEIMQSLQQQIATENSFIIAYEPVWAIGTGKTATPEQAQAVHKIIREKLAALTSAEQANSTSILYGGSVNAKNAQQLLAQNDIDGALVGGASLDAKSFLSIYKQIS